MAETGSSLYPVLTLGGILLSAAVWSFLVSRRGAPDRRLPLVYLGGLLGALLGAKGLFLLAEGFPAPPPAAGVFEALRWGSGKSVLGALLGGYAGVEAIKRLTGYRKPTGDLFAVATPLGLVLGRVGCILGGCCLGRICEPAWYALRDAQGMTRWPAAPVELLFNAGMLMVALWAFRRGWARGQLFHIYLMAYGLFRVVHELVRETPRILGPLTVYQLAAAAVFLLGLLRYRQRARFPREEGGAAPPAPARAVAGAAPLQG